jgi:hypothetical protein
MRGVWFTHMSNITTTSFEQCHRLRHAEDMLGGRQQEIHVERDRKLAEARQQLQIRRQQVA